MALFGVYVFWNAACLAYGVLPPSLFLVVTGLPCPTTGCSRSLIRLLHGDWAASLQANAFTVPICILLAATLAWLAWSAATRRRFRLPSIFGWAWLVVLLAAWFFKLLGSPEYW